MNPNTFKSGDRFKIFGGGTYRVSYISGPYIYYRDEIEMSRSVHHTNCKLVEAPQTFAPGDIVRHPTLTDTGIGVILDKECGVGGMYSAKWPTAKYGECRDDVSGYVLVSRANAIDDFLKDGKYIEAIKEYRVRHGVGLKEAKDAIDALRNKPKFDDGGPYNEPQYQTLGGILNTALKARELAKNKFKVGDNIKTKWGNHRYLVSDVRPSDGYLYFKEYPNAGYNNPNIFELITHTVPTIVVRHDVGKGYRPNDKPRVHNTVAEATKEAERLAYANPGVKFDTFTLVTSSVATAPVEGTVTTVSV